MNKYLTMFTSSAIILLAGCHSVRTKEVVTPTVPLKEPWSEEDSFRTVRTVSGTSQLPVEKISSRGKASKAPRLNLALKNAAYNGSKEAKAILAKMQNDANVDDVICQALEFIVKNNMRSPLNEKYVKEGIRIAAKRRKRVDYDFAPPSGELIFSAKQKNDNASKVILLYQARCKLRQDIFDWLKDCGLKRKDIYWIPLFTYLELELLGIEQAYKEIASAGKN